MYLKGLGNIWSQKRPWNSVKTEQTSHTFKQAAFRTLDSFVTKAYLSMQFVDVDLEKKQFEYGNKDLLIEQGSFCLISFVLIICRAVYFCLCAEIMWSSNEYLVTHKNID